MADLPMCKILFNSVLSKPNGWFMTIDLKDFCLGMPVPNKERVRICFKNIPKELLTP
jgi:hypothetical protein